MGGFGSGRRCQDGKAITTNRHALDVRHLQKRNLLRPGLFFSLEWRRNHQTLASTLVQVDDDKLVLSYRRQNAGGEWQDREHPVLLDWTPCNYGGRRAWTVCPARGCGRRVAILYLGDSGSFACRHCCQLAYSTQRETDSRRAMLRADNIRERLGWKPGILNGSGSKPKGMQWQTYWRLHAQHDAYVTVWLDRTAKRLGLVNQGLSRLKQLLTKKT